MWMSKPDKSAVCFSAMARVVQWAETRDSRALSRPLGIRKKFSCVRKEVCRDLSGNEAKAHLADQCPIAIYGHPQAALSASERSR